MNRAAGAHAHGRESDAKSTRLASEKAALSPGQQIASTSCACATSAWPANRPMRSRPVDPAAQGHSFRSAAESLVTAINLAANIEDWSQAFTLAQRRAFLPAESRPESAALLGVAITCTVWWRERTRPRTCDDALQVVEASNDPHACAGPSAMGHGLDQPATMPIRRRWRRRQIEPAHRSVDVCSWPTRSRRRQDGGCAWRRPMP